MGVYVFDGQICEYCDGTGGDCHYGMCYECNGNGTVGESDACVVCGMPAFQGCDCEDDDQDDDVRLTGDPACGY
jgi:hypothetical protein